MTVGTLLGMCAARQRSFSVCATTTTTTTTATPSDCPKGGGNRKSQVQGTRGTGLGLLGCVPHALVCEWDRELS